ncbi:MAG: amidase family protein [Cyanobacteria bacterium J06649_4]
MAEQAATVSDTFEIEEATIAQLQVAMAESILSASELVDYYLARIERLDETLKSLITLNPNAKITAAKLDKERSTGKLRGPLHGIPVVVKDNIDTAHMPTTGGCVAMATSQPPDDAFVVARLREAGAIILAKANLHELSCGEESVSSLGGQTCNPYDLSYTPGGSSGGTAVAIAANLAVVGLGSDTEGSVRSPAAACNIVGLRPTAGLVSRDGLMPVALSQDTIGPMGRSVTDVAALLGVIATDDPEDPMTARSTGKLHDSYHPFLKEDGLKGMRLGVIASFYGTEPACQGVNALMTAALDEMEALGAQRVSVAANIDMDGLSEELSLIRWEFRLHFEQYLETLSEPSAKTAPVANLKALLKAGKVHRSIQSQLKAANAVASPLGDSDYWQRLYPQRVELRQVLTQLFQRHQINALIYPAQRQPVAAIGESQQGLNGFLAAASGFPAITVPAGFLESGLPVGLELMGLPFQEAALLKMAYAYEQKTQWRRAPLH